MQYVKNLWLSDEQRRVVCQLMHDRPSNKMSVIEVGKLFNVGKSCVYDVYKRFVDTGDYKGIPPPGRPLKFDKSK